MHLQSELAAPLRPCSFLEPCSPSNFRVKGDFADMAQLQSADRTRSTGSGGSPEVQQISDDQMASDSAPIRLFMTGDVRAATGLSRTHLDFYIREGLVKPAARTESGYLLFDHTEVDLLREIIAARQSGVPLKDIRKRIGR